jgi:hypothetical protein
MVLLYCLVYNVHLAAIAAITFAAIVCAVPYAMLRYSHPYAQYAVPIAQSSTMIHQTRNSIVYVCPGTLLITSLLLNTCTAHFRMVVHPL